MIEEQKKEKQIESDSVSLFKPLVEYLNSGPCVRLVARPKRITADSVEGLVCIDLPWDDEKHQRACVFLSSNPILFSNIRIQQINETIVLQKMWDESRGLDSLVKNNWISELASQTLCSSLAIGKNVLIAGPYLPCVEVICALVNEGQRPMVVGDKTLLSYSVPAHWLCLPDLEYLEQLGPDRIGTWSLHGVSQSRLLNSMNSVISWQPAHRLDQALMRFELAQADSQLPPPLVVMGGIDLIVVMSTVGAPRVQEIAQIELADDSYRPRLLFTHNIPPVRSALVPVGIPSYIDDLVSAGYSLVSEELKHAVVDNQAVPDESINPSMHFDPAPALVPPVVAKPAVSSIRETSSSQSKEAMPELDPPGWELDQLDDTSSIASETGELGTEYANMAATYGLAPPPAPPGMAPIAPEIIQEHITRTSFEETISLSETLKKNDAIPDILNESIEDRASHIEEAKCIDEEVSDDLQKED